MKFDKNIPIPTRTKYKFSEMEIGDSAWWPANSSKLAMACASFRNRHPDFKFTCRTEFKNGVKGARVWRIENDLAKSE